MLQNFASIYSQDIVTHIYIDLLQASRCRIRAKHLAGFARHGRFCGCTVDWFNNAFEDARRDIALNSKKGDSYTKTGRERYASFAAVFMLPRQQPAGMFRGIIDFCFSGVYNQGVATFI